MLPIVVVGCGLGGWGDRIRRLIKRICAPPIEVGLRILKTQGIWFYAIDSGLPNQTPAYRRWWAKTLNRRVHWSLYG